VELLSSAEDVAINESTDGVAVAVGAVVVELASSVTGRDVDFGKVTLASDLDVFGGLDEMDPLEGALRHHARTVARLGTIRNHLAFGVADSLLGGRYPKAEVFDAVEPWIIRQSRAELLGWTYRGFGT